ncbi:MAG: PDZ domain-containing protein, partial [Deltaproteobacteria bacterium]|nr:PDZ domain-containing protein [Deltaproteobacteria bacterium]
TGVDLSDLTAHWVRSREDIDYATALAPVGLEPRWTQREGAPSGALGLRVRAGLGSAGIAGVVRGSAAERAGIEAGDEIVAIDGIRVDESRIADRIRTRKPGDQVRLTFFRRERLCETVATLDAAKHDQLAIVPVEGATSEAVALRDRWLAGELEAARG